MEQTLIMLLITVCVLFIRQGMAIELIQYPDIGFLEEPSSELANEPVNETKKGLKGELNGEKRDLPSGSSEGVGEVELFWDGPTSMMIECKLMAHDSTTREEREPNGRNEG